MRAAATGARCTACARVLTVVLLALLLRPAPAQVTEEDVAAAFRLWHEALSVSAADEEGRLDLNLLTSGASGAAQAFLADALPALLRGLLRGERRRAPSACRLACFAPSACERRGRPC